MNFGTVAILGPGLIGGSLALALTERGLAEKLVIYARREASFPAIKAKLPQAELTLDVKAAVRNADVVVLCVPIETMKPLVKQFASSLKPTALVTDVGSVKESVENELAPLLHGKALWIGSHPMAGSEQAGFAIARADLFEGATVIVTPTEKTPRDTQHSAEKFWAALGGRVAVHSPIIHDISVAQVSHLPHLLAAALVDHVQNSEPDALDLVGGGFRDSTRIAAGSPELWVEILSANSKALAHALEPFINKLDHLKRCLKDADLERQKENLRQLLKDAQDVRSKIPENRPKNS